MRWALALLLATVSGWLGAEPLKIGALLSLTGNWSNLGRSSEIVMEMAEHDINAYLRRHRANYQVKVIVEDTALEPERALRAYETLVSRGVVALVGPQSSSEVAYLAPTVGRNKIPILSQGSTASSLGQPGDHVYRVVPNDVRESDAMATLLGLHGIKVLVPLWRDDLGNKGLHDSLEKRFVASGGVMTAGVRYSTASDQDFAAVVQEASRQAADAVRRVGGNLKQVAIYTASFDEIVQVMTAADADPLLGLLRWYGGDGVVQSAALAGDLRAARFAIKVNYLSPNLGLSATSAAKANEVSDRYRALTGSSPDAFTLAAYDATWLVALAANGKRSLLKGTAPDPLLETSDWFFGTTGWTRLDANGDRLIGDYDFWGLIPGASGAAEWVVLCHYDPILQQVTGEACVPKQSP